MAWVQSDLDVIEAAIKTGVLTVHFADRTITYRSLAEMITIRGLIREAVQTAAGNLTSRVSFIRVSKG